MKKFIIKKFIKEFWWVVAIAILASFGFWAWFDRPFHFGESGYIEIDYFNTVCGVFTVVGLVIAIYQIAQIKTEQEIVELTIANTRIKTFKEDTLLRFNNFKAEILDFQSDISAGNYSDTTVKGFFRDLNRFKQLIQDTQFRQENLTNGDKIPCKDCVPLLDELIEECLRVMNIKLWGSLKRPLFFTHLKQILSIITDCEYKLRK